MINFPYPLPSDTTSEVDERAAAVALLPVGSYEQHGPHLPLVTDTLIACAIADRLAAAYPVQQLPPLTISCSHEHERWPGTVSISATTLHAVVSDIAASLRRGGTTALVVVNAHGGNHVLRNTVQESTARGERMALFPTADDWRTAAEDAGIHTDAHSDMHAGELETSILLHVGPQLVRIGHESMDHVHEDRRHLLTLGMDAYTASGVIGRPSLASAEKGQRLLAGLTESFADHLSALGVR
ncbi:creatininase family protein [Streptomyces yunnanensis]|uniref:Creatininase family protein n=1 Tax=Streptomyces yunnanensis TaxID=156453 RepID=A0ABY7ZZ09_9ACTN|nr:creatininase family protein [Streptomyces yunnanensis]WEB37930.1 creatininase family protein [Streptomyces yunnanensis]WEB45497.1 creatininase family protein [Streptomyces yunnanensis]